jgi:nicotinamidase-related amidase
MKQLVESIRTSTRAGLGPHSAVLAIHWQTDVVAPTGTLNRTFAKTVERKGIIPKTANVIARARQAGSKIIYVNVLFEQNYVGLVRNNALWNMVSQSGGFVRGATGLEVVPALAPHADDVVLTHSRISCFYGTELLTVLIGNGITDLYLTGVATNVAVDHTARDAVQLGFNTYIVDDCCASSDDDHHNASLQTLRVVCTGIVQSQELLA